MSIAPARDAGAAPGLEIERKFLVAELPDDLETYPSEVVSQGYLAVDPNGAEVRVRRAGADRVVTVKQGHGLARVEVEFAIDPSDFERLWAGTSRRRTEKRRFRIPAGDGLTIELDRFHGDLDGLLVAEIEFPSEEAARAFRAPDWLRPEVTGDARYANARLAVDGIPDRRTPGDRSLLDGEDPGEGLVHVILATIDEAADALQGRDALEPSKAIHTARKAFKRGKALVRLAAEGLGPEITARDRGAFQEAGRLLSGARDAQVAIETLDGLATRHPDALGAPVTGGLRSALEQDAARSADSGEEAIGAVLVLLERLRGDLSDWDLGDAPADVLADGLLRMHRRGRKALRKARHAGGPEATEALHSLRKRAKELWYAAELLEVAAPKRMRALAKDSHDLSDLVGDDHDLAVLLDLSEAYAAAGGDADDAAALADAIAKRRSKLEHRALRLAGDLYDDAPARLAERVRELDHAH